MTDRINKPKHYQFGEFQAIDVIEKVCGMILDPVAALLHAQVLKYVIRWPRKDGVADLKKARWYLDREIARLDGVKIPPPPDYAPESAAFRHGDAEYFALNYGRVPGIGDVPHVTAAVLAERDGAMEYGNPVTPCVLACAQSDVNAQDKIHSRPDGVERDHGWVGGMEHACGGQL